MFGCLTDRQLIRSSAVHQHFKTGNLCAGYRYILNTEHIRFLRRRNVCGVQSIFKGIIVVAIESIVDAVPVGIELEYLIGHITIVEFQAEI